MKNCASHHTWGNPQMKHENQKEEDGVFYRWQDRKGLKRKAAGTLGEEEPEDPIFKVPSLKRRRHSALEVFDKVERIRKIQEANQHLKTVRNAYSSTNTEIARTFLRHLKSRWSLAQFFTGLHS